MEEHKIPIRILPQRKSPAFYRAVKRAFINRSGWLKKLGCGHGKSWVDIGLPPNLVNSRGRLRRVACLKCGKVKLKKIEKNPDDIFF